jgi:hypothetical protein
MSDCYKTGFHLHSAFHAALETPSIFQWWQGKTILQWMFVTEPKHLFLSRILENIVELVHSEYMHDSKIGIPLVGENKFLPVICGTGPVVFAASILEVITGDELRGTNYTYRYIGKDFESVGGHYKAGGYSTEHEGHNYISEMRQNNVMFLKEYVST